MKNKMYQVELYNKNVNRFEIIDEKPYRITMGLNVTEKRIIDVKNKWKKLVYMSRSYNKRVKYE
jgi:hypothetical protein